MRDKGENSHPCRGLQGNLSSGRASRCWYRKVKELFGVEDARVEDASDFADD